MNKINRTTAASVLFGIALVLCICMGGGGQWYSCIIPVAIAFLSVFVAKKKFDNINIMFVAVMVFVAIIPLFFTLADKHNAIHEIEKLLCFVVAFLFGLEIKDEDTIPKYIFLGAAVLAVFGLVCYIGVFSNKEFVFNDRGILRLQSFLEYANTTAVILGMGYFASLKLYGKYLENLISFIASCILLALYLTVSKAAIPIFIAVGTVFVGIKKEYADRFILQNIVCISFALGIIIFKSFYVILLITGIAVSSVVKYKSENLFKIWVVSLLIAVGTFVSVAVYRDYKILETLLKRFDYMQDSLRLLKDNCFLGIGSGGWRYYQYSVQQSQYNTAYIHNGWLQFWIENGIVFLLCLVILFVKTIVSLVKSKSSVLCAVLILALLHSFIDIDFGFGAMLTILGVIAGSALANDRKVLAIKPMTISLVVILCISLSYMTLEYCVRLGFENSYLNKNNSQALSRALLLEKICPYDGELKVSIAALDEKNSSRYIKKARETSPLNPDIAETEIDYLLSHSYDGVLDKCRSYIDMAPKQEKTYVKVKHVAQVMLDNGLCLREEYDEFIRYVDERRTIEGVIDRNDLLETLWVDRKKKQHIETDK